MGIFWGRLSPQLCLSLPKWVELQLCSSLMWYHHHQLTLVGSTIPI